MAIVLCRRCLTRLRSIVVSPSPLSPSPHQLLLLLRRDLKSLPLPRKTRDPPNRPKWFVHRIAQLPESPMSPSTTAGNVALHLVARTAAAIAAGGLLCLAVCERRSRHRRDSAASLLAPFDFGYADIADATADGVDRVLRDLRLGAPCWAFCLAALVIGNLLRSRRMSTTTLAKLCRHTFDQPGRSALLTSPWLSSFCALHATEFLFSSIAMIVFSMINFGFTPEEKILAFVTGALAGSSGRCAYQQLLLLLDRRRCLVGHWYGAHSGLAMLTCLLLLALRRDALKAQLQQREQQKAPSGLVEMPRSAQRVLLDLRPGLCLALLGGWAAFDLACLVLLRKRLAPSALGAVAPPLKHASSLAGLMAACGVHATLEFWSADPTAPAASASVSASASAASSASA